MPSKKTNPIESAGEIQPKKTKSTPVKRRVPTPPVYNHAADVSQNRALAAMAYFWIFCIIPLVAKKNSPYAQFHAKQGVVLAFTWFLLWMVNIIPLLGQIIFLIGILPLIAVNILAILKAWNGEEWKIPYLYHYVSVLNL